MNHRSVLSFFLWLAFSANVFAGLEKIPVQDGGRIKPFDTFAREMLHLVWGKESYKGRAAADVVFSWMLIPDEWEKTEFVLVRHSGLREAMNLENQRLYYSPSEIMLNPRLGLLVQELRNKRDAQEKLDPFFQAVQTLENQISVFHAVRMGLGIRVTPPMDENSSTWLNLSQLEGEAKAAFEGISQQYVAMAVAKMKSESRSTGEVVELDARVNKFIQVVEDKNGDYSGRNKIAAELFYNKYHPFRASWVFYFAALILFSFAYFGTRSSWMKAGWAFTVLAAIFQTVGFGLRVYILERAPVTNMFETVSWVALTAVLMAAIFYRFNRAKILPVAATLVATLSLILCDISSSVLDDALTPLEPVLRDNFWLLTHVVIIVTSYAAFFLAFFIGDIMLFYFLKDEKKYASEIAQGANSIYRSIQVGVVLLTAGVILGGIWADYSWGRFWGWDPKETWAFIALLGYLVILHGRLIGWLRNFGLAVSSVIAFSLVIMAWYGVNFVLGAGLHTYGFGAGGVEYVSMFVCAHLLFVAYVTTLRQSRLKASKT